MSVHPKRRKARYHRVTLHSGHILEIGWHFGRQLYVVTIWHPDNYKDTDTWAAEKQIFGNTPREVLSGARLEVAEQTNPNVKAVRERVAGENFSVDKLRRMQAKMMTMGSRYGAGATLYMNKKLADSLESMGGNLGGINPKVVITDELNSMPDSIFADIADSMKLKWPTDPTDKK